MKPVGQSLGVVGMLSVCLCLAGCSTSFDPQLSGAPVSGTGAIKGQVYGGNQPVTGAEIFLLESNSAGYAGPGITSTNGVGGNASKSLLTSATGTSATLNGVTSYYVATSANGSFLITGDYTCDAGEVVYLYSLGGNPGAGGTNTAAGFISVLGVCPSSAPFNLASVPFVWMSEVSTVASAYALAGFASDATHIGTSGTALQLLDIQNAANNAGNLVNIATGVTWASNLTPGGNGTIPYKTINTIANILAACVNSASSSSTNCTTLFGGMKSAGTSGTSATDTATSAVYFAHNPANIDGTTLFALQAASGAPFASDLSAAPNDWGIAVTYTGGGLNNPYMVAIDGSGNVWVDNQNGNSLSKFNPLGVAQSGSSGYTGGGISSPTGIAIDGSGNVWVTGSGSLLAEFSNSGSVLSGTGYTGWGGGTGIAIDANGDVWGANASAGVIKFHGAESGGTPGTVLIARSNVGSPNQGLWMGLDSSGNVWVANANSTLSKINSTATSASVYTATGIGVTEWIAFDSLNNAWTCDGTVNASGVDELTSSGTVNQSVTGVAGVKTPYTIQIDGAGRAWLANSSTTAISELTSSAAAISPSTGYLSPAAVDLYAAAVDGSGNVWAVDSGNHLIQWVGMSAPLHTPETPGQHAKRP